MRKFFEQYPLTDEVIAAGVSGGADSLALVLRLKDMGRKVVALSVDHGLRPESADEVAYVAKIMADEGIEHHILKWEGTKPTTAIEAEAREARYNLLCSWCWEHKIKYLAVGHHRRDQAETFLLRLQRGSGLYGLSGMQPLSWRNGIGIIRPQLDDNPDDLRAYLQERKIRWVEDPSNQSLDFQRVKMRKFLPELERKTGISEERLAETAAILARSRAFIESEVEHLRQTKVRNYGKRIFSLAGGVVAAVHEELGYRLLGNLLCQSGELEYPPEAVEVLRLLAELQQPNFKGATLGGCEIFAAQKRIWIVPELRISEVLSKAKWEKILQFLPQYANASLPYKVRRALCYEYKKVSDGKENKK